MSLRAALARGPQRVKASSTLQEGSKLNGFVVRKIFPVKEFDIEAIHLEHEVTKARYVHVDCDDTNNVFGVIFRTPASDSTGLPHILEHTVLCGSDRYPVRDPFFNMTKRSLNTFMNAMTASDHTMYPFATRNEQDFSNLMQVYLDAVFFPKLEHMDFLQEGHRLEIDPTDETKVIRTGVVYNEMKGTLGNASTIFFNRLQEVLLPGTQYANISGGDPKFIPDLSHETLVEYHRKHYHPSNALFYTYGDLPIQNHVELLNSCALDHFQFSKEAQDVKYSISSSSIDVTQRPSVDNPVRFKGPAEPMLEKQGMFCMSRALANNSSERESEYDRMVGRIASNLLLEGSSAPLYTALIDAHLAPDFSPGTGYDSSSLHPSIGVGVQGVDCDDETVKSIRSVIESCLKQVSMEGLDERRVQAVLHQLELSLKQKHTNFGMAVMYALAQAFAHTAETSLDGLIAALNENITVDNKINRLCDEMAADPQFWQNKVRDLFFEDDPASPGAMRLRSDFVAVIMEPENDFVTNLAEEERKKLVELSSKLLPDDLQSISHTAAELEAIQAQEQDVSCLPTLHISDVPRIPEETISVEQINGSNLLWVNNQQTNGIVYFRAFFDTSDVPKEYFPLLSLLSTLLGSVDTKMYSYQDLSVEADLICDGLTYTPSVVNWYAPGDSPMLPSNHRLLHSKPDFGSSATFQPPAAAYRQGIMVSGFSLERNLDKTVALLAEVLRNSIFEKNLHHVESLLATSVNAASSNITSSSLGYARKWNLATLGDDFAKRESLTGLSQIELLLSCSQSIHETLPALQNLLDFIFRPEKMSMCVCAGGSQISKDQVLNSLQSLNDRLGENRDPANLPSGSHLSSAGVLSKISSRSPFDLNYIPLPISVHNAAVAMPTHVPYGHPDDAGLMVLAQIMSSNFLHKQIRERGGAYGGGCSHDMGGLFHFYSYYDPKGEESVKAFGQSLQWVLDGSFSDRDIEESLLSVFGSIDAPQEVRTKGSGPFLYGVSPEARQGLRSRFFELNKQKLLDIAERRFGPVVRAAGTPQNAFLSTPLQGAVTIAGNADTKLSSNDWKRKELK